MYLQQKNKKKNEVLVSRSNAILAVENFLKSVSKPNITTATDNRIVAGVGTLVMWDSDSPDEKSYLRFPLTAPDDTSSDLNMHSGVILLQDRLDIVHIFDQYFNSEGLIGVESLDSQEYLFLNVYDRTSFSVSYNVMQYANSSTVLIKFMEEKAKKNIDSMYQKLIFDKINLSKEKKDKK